MGNESEIKPLVSQAAEPTSGDSTETSTNTPEDSAASTQAAISAEAPPEEVVPLTPAEMDRHECRACGYTYEPVKGDSQSKIAPGTSFDELSEKWRCPVCGAPKRQFSNVGPQGNPSGFKENLGYGFGVNTLTPGQKNILIFGSLALAFMFFLSLYGLR